MFSKLLTGYAQNNDSLNYAFLDAVYENKKDSVIFFLNKGADIRFKTLDSVSALHYSVMNQNVELTSLLLDLGAETNCQDFEGNTPLMLASSQGIDTLMFLLIMYDALPDIQNNEGETALHNAVLSGNPMAVDMLLFYNAKPDVQDNLGCTPLHYAVYNGMNLVVEMLLRYGANAEMKDNRNEDPRFYAVYADSPVSLKLLIDVNKDIIGRNVENNNIIETAFLYGSADLLDTLVMYLLPEHSGKKEISDFFSANLNSVDIWKTILISDNSEKIRLARIYRIQRPIQPITGHIYSTIGMTLSDDFFATFSVLQQEVNYRLYYGAGIGSRLWRNSMLMERSVDTVYQLSEYRVLFWPEISKYLPVYRNRENNQRIDIVFGLRAPLTWANYSGLAEKDKLRFTYLMFAGFDYVFYKIKINLAYQYWKYDASNFSRHQISLGFAFR